ncbi:hypothetical protein CRUP_008688, partial [Coryphaenoides rupestris]
MSVSSPRPSGVKALPLRPPPIKTLPGRPPPPTINRTSSSVANETAPSRPDPGLSVSSANQPPSLQEGPTPSSAPANHTQGQRATKKGPPLPPRPKPGHPLYNSYMKQEVLVVLDDHGSTPPPPQLVKEQSVDQSPCLLDIQPELLPVLDSHKVVSEEIGTSDIQSSIVLQPPKQKDPELTPISGPRCVARCDYDGQDEDELTFSQGDVIALSELIGQDWGRGQIHGRTGIFPLAVTQVLEPLPPPVSTATTKAVTTDVKILENTEPPPSKDPVIPTEEEQVDREEEEEEEEEWALAVFNFPGQTAEDLSFQHGALIRVLQHLDSDWRRGRLEGREGLYPVAFTKPYPAQPIPGEQPAGGGVAKALFDFTAESEDELTLKEEEQVDREEEEEEEEWALAVFNFPGQTAEDLSFQHGALIRVLQHLDSDWRRGRLEGREGLYPVAFTKPYPAQPIPGEQPAGGGVAKALFDFTAESEDELTLKIGDIIREVESLDEQWIMGVVGGKRGIVPKNYISL